MKVAFICGLHPTQDHEIVKKSKVMPQYAADRTARNLAEGLKNILLKNITIINMPFIGGFPFGHRLIYAKSYEWAFLDEKQENTVAFLNINYLSHFFRQWAVTKRTIKWVNVNVNQEQFIIGYAMTSSTLAAFKAAKRKNKRVTTCLIVPDLPEYMNLSINGLKKILLNIVVKKQKKMLKYVDTYALFSIHMADALKIGNKPFCVVEGTVNSNIKYEEINEPNFHKNIVYTGSVNLEYGIELLLKAFSKIEGDEYKLQIAGSGNGLPLVNKFCEIDSRIQYLGVISNSEAIELQKNASVLVNPRTAEHDFTKFSFPSKLLEYLSSGNPVLTFKLPGIPDEYDEYLQYFDNSDSLYMAKRIQEVCNWDNERKENNAKRSIIFLNNNVSGLEQAKKILELRKNNI